MSTPDSHIIDILPETPEPEKSDNQQDKERDYRLNDTFIKRPINDGLQKQEIIRRYREYAKKFEDNPNEWPNKRHQTTCKDKESSCVIRKLYETTLTDTDILTIIQNNYNGYNAPDSVLIDYITPADEYGYTFMNYTPTSIFSTLFGKFGFGGKSHKKRKSHKKPRKSRKSQKRKSIKRK
jgi:hypothetical protein